MKKKRYMKTYNKIKLLVNKNICTKAPKNETKI